jgi:hypothetical protein
LCRNNPRKKKQGGNEEDHPYEKNWAQPEQTFYDQRRSVYGFGVIGHLYHPFLQLHSRLSALRSPGQVQFEKKGLEVFTGTCKKK